MVVTLTGENNFALRSALTNLRTDFVMAYGPEAIEFLDSQENNFARIQQSLQSPPFLSKRKMLILYRPSANQNFVELIEDLINGLPATNDLVLVEPKIDKRTVLYKTLVKDTELREFNTLAEYDLSQWLIKTAQLKGGRISQSAARMMVDRLGTDQQLLDNELEKLLLFEPIITEQTIELLTEPSPQNTIFSILNSAFAGNYSRSMKVYDEQRSQRVDPGRIIALLAWQLRVLAIIKTASGRSVDAIAKQSKIKPNVIRNNQVLASNISLGQIKKLILDLLLIDVRSKSEGIDLDEALKLFLLQVKM